MRSAVRPTIFLLAAACAGCIVVSAPAPPAGDGDPAPEPTTAAVETGLLNEANRLRARERLRPLEPSDVLDRAARAHVRELADRQVLDHVSRDPERATLALRMQLAGVTDWRRIAENLASVRNPTIGPERAIARLWLDSPPHRASLLEPSFDRVGTGVARASDGTWYAVQVYGAGIETGAAR